MNSIFLASFVYPVAVTFWLTYSSGAVEPGVFGSRGDRGVLVPEGYKYLSIGHRHLRLNGNFRLVQDLSPFITFFKPNNVTGPDIAWNGNAEMFSIPVSSWMISGAILYCAGIASPSGWMCFVKNVLRGGFENLTEMESGNTGRYNPLRGLPFIGSTDKWEIVEDDRETGLYEIRDQRLTFSLMIPKVIRYTVNYVSLSESQDGEQLPKEGPAYPQLSVTQWTSLAEINDGIILEIYADFEIEGEVQRDSTGGTKIVIKRCYKTAPHLIKLYKVVLDLEYLIELHLYRPAQM